MEPVIIKIKSPGAGVDASPAIQEALKKAEKCEGEQKIIIEFEKGQYDVWPETSIYNTGYYVSNSAPKELNPNGERWSALVLKNMKNVIIKGNDALLMIHGIMTPIIVDECEDILIENLNIDYARSTVSEMTVMSSNPEKGTVFHVDPVADYEIIEDGKCIRWLGEKRLGMAQDTDLKSYYWHWDCGGYDSGAEYNPESGKSVRKWGRDKNAPINYSAVEKIEELGNHQLRITFNDGTTYKEGNVIWTRFGSGSQREQVGSFFHRSKNVHLNNMGIHYMHGLGLVAQYTENVTYTNLNCTPRRETGRVCSSSADFMQVSGCKGLVDIENCKFQGSDDDVFNIHGSHLQIIERDTKKRQLTVEFPTIWSWGFQAFNKGDKIEFINADTMIPYAENIVKDFERLDDTKIKLTLEGALPEELRVGVDVVENATYTPDVLIKGNKAKGVTTRGVLCTTRGKVVIEDNHFIVDMNGVLLEDDTRVWFESGYIRDMTIRNNTFENCGYPTIHSNPQTQNPAPDKTVHANMVIEGNRFIGVRNPDVATIQVDATRNVVIKDNVLEDNGRIIINNCNGYEVKNNVGASDVTVTNSLNKR